MDADSKYPNRAKPAAEPPRPRYSFDASAPEDPRDKSAATESQGSEDEKTEEIELHYSGYRVIDPIPDSPPSIIAETEPLLLSSVSEEVKEKKTKSKTKIPQLQLAETQENPIPNLPKKPTMVYVAAFAILGVLMGLGIAYWFVENGGQYDLGTYTLNSAGLKGHLSTKWENKPLYRLTIEPSDKGRQDGFALAAAHSSIPLSIDIYLQDVHGVVLCSKVVILKYNAEDAATSSVPVPDSEATSTDNDDISDDQLTQGIDRARYEAQEPERELDKDMFQNQIGKNGQIASMHAEGELPCSKKTYGDIFAWSFSTNFPTVTVQDELQKLEQEVQEKDTQLSAAELAARRARASKSGIRPLPFSMEGDDSILEFDATRGVIETRGEKTFYFDKTSGQGSDPKWQDYPVGIHYRCESTGRCIISKAGLGALRVSMR
ncbi:MAG: hypothetical protein ABSD72_04110 [Terracidiphilus sp.]|jgi:hypothetical protein